MNSPDRHEPVMHSGAQQVSEDEEVRPLLLTDLIREGLPAPLWRQGHGSMDMPTNPQGEEIDTIQGGVDTRDEMPGVSLAEELPPISPPDAPSFSADKGELPPPPTANLGSGDPSSGGSLEAQELSRALERIRRLSQPSEDYTVAPADGLEEHAPTETPPTPEPLLSEVAGSDLSDHNEVSQPSFGISLNNETIEPIADPAPIVPQMLPPPAPTDANLAPPQRVSPVTDTQLMQEWEQRIVDAVLSEVNHRLQSHWREQVNRAIVRTLAMEDLRLREAIRNDLTRELPALIRQILNTDGETLPEDTR